jgi:hypothetical protein
MHLTNSAVSVLVAYSAGARKLLSLPKTLSKLTRGLRRNQNIIAA